MNSVMDKTLSKIVIALILCLGMWKGVVSAPLSQIENLTFSNNASALIFTDAAGTEITSIDVRTGKVLKQVPIKLPLSATLIDATPDGFKLLFIDPKGISVIHNGTGNVLRTLPHPSGGYQAIKQVGLMAQNTNGSLIAIPYTKGVQATIFVIHTGSE